jgi:GT2 family glycosyltransferase
MKDFKRVIEILLFWIITTIKYLSLGLKKGHFFSYLKSYVKEFFLQLEVFSKHLEEYKNIEDLQHNQIERLKVRVDGLQSLLPLDQQRSHSVILVIDKSFIHHLNKTLDSISKLSALKLEILIGVKGSKDELLEKTVSSFLKKKSYQIHFYPDNLSRTSICNDLVRKSKGDFLFFLDVGDFVRPDLLYRYEQTLSLFKEAPVLFCDEYLVNRDYTLIPHTQTKKPENPNPDFVFNDLLDKTLLIPKYLWEKVGGLNESCDDFHAFDLPFRLHQVGAVFQKVPLALYAVLQENKLKQYQRYENQLNTITTYLEKRSLEKRWTWQKGLSKNSLRAIPSLQALPNIHVVMLFKDQHNLTISAIEHLQKQVGVNLKITAVDNNSSDSTIAQKLEKLGVEVIRIDEPFNYSRLNNLALKNSRFGKDCESVLFINNDVDLDKNALIEMSRWLNQSEIGMVGCRLNYPNGLLQHGGVIIESTKAAFIKSWHHHERLRKVDELEETSSLNIVPAVTAACCLVRKQDFENVGGFDEVIYPVAFSDTALAIKIRALGLSCFYTPFAFGVHHESISRSKINIEDFESLTWTHKKFVENLFKDKEFKFVDLKNTEY